MIYTIVHFAAAGQQTAVAFVKPVPLPKGIFDHTYVSHAVSLRSMYELKYKSHTYCLIRAWNGNWQVGRWQCWRTCAWYAFRGGWDKWCLNAQHASANYALNITFLIVGGSVLDSPKTDRSRQLVMPDPNTLARIQSWLTGKTDSAYPFTISCEMN